MDNVKGKKSDQPTDPDLGKQDVDPDLEGKNSKEENLAALRKKNEDLAAELAEEKRLRQEEIDKRDLGSGEGDDDDDEDDEEDKKNKSKSDKSEYQKIIFDRDKRRALKSWNNKNKVSAEEWKLIQSKVTLSGDETDLEIEEKIDSAYHSLPSVRQRIEKDIKEKARKEAMKEFRDEELDLGEGGDADYGVQEDEGPRLTSREKKLLDAFGVKEEDRKKIDKNSESYRKWKILDPQRK